MELCSYRFPKTKEMLLMPVGDIQWAGDDEEVALGMLKRHIQWGVDNGAWFIGMGDYIDAFSPSNRMRLATAALYDTAMKQIDEMAEKRVQQLIDEALAPSKGRWLGLLEGHHFHNFRDGTTSDQLLADKLETRFLGSSAFVRLVFPKCSEGVKNSSTGSVVIWAHHGNGGGMRLGSPLNKLDQLPAFWDADIYLMGHHHKKVAGPMDRLEPIFPPNGKPELVHRTKIMACTGSFLKGWQAFSKQGGVPRGHYPEQKMLGTVALGGVLIKIRPRWEVLYPKGRKHYGVWRPDLSVEL